MPRSILFVPRECPVKQRKNLLSFNKARIAVGNPAVSAPGSAQINLILRPRVLLKDMKRALIPADPAGSAFVRHDMDLPVNK
jgi:hypothetical protein